MGSLEEMPSLAAPATAILASSMEVVRQRRCSLRNLAKKRPYCEPQKSEPELAPSPTPKKRLARKKTEADHGKQADPDAKRDLAYKRVVNLGKEVTETPEIVEAPEVLEAPVTSVQSFDVTALSNSSISGKVYRVVGQGNLGETNIETAKNDHVKVKEVLREFNKHYLHCVQVEEKRAREEKQKPRKLGVSKSSKTKGGEGDKEDVKRTSKRPDLKALSLMLESKRVANHDKRVGSLPGIDVGQQFFSRAEMVAVGMHSHWLNGIDYMGTSYAKTYEGYKFPLAICIVISGIYEDDLDNCESVIYTGQGGIDLLGNKLQVKDQKMERGNLALKNSMESGLPVRVVRGHESRSSYCGKVYTYDGLYQVEDYWAETGLRGFTVFKYKLKRVPGQPPLTTSQVRFIREDAPVSISELRGLVCEDISGGQENFGIPATNLVDDPPVAPTGFVYSKSVQISEKLNLFENAVGCKCKGVCTDPKVCACAKLNGSDFPYVEKDGGRLIEAKAVVFECGPNCGCTQYCVNRTSQKGLRYRLEVFRTPNKGWGVRSWDTIPPGAPVCEYTGILMKTDEADHKSGNNYIFDIDCLQTMKGLDGREMRSGDLSLLTNIDDKKSDAAEYCIDAGPVGSVARFINHSCQPNLFVQCVLSSHHDIRLARIMLFAADAIPPLQELTYDYGYALDSVVGPDGNIVQMPCYCGAVDCRKRLY